MMKYKIAHIVVIALAFALLLLPFGVHHVTVAPSEASGVLHETIDEYSYFHMEPFKGGNFTPLFTAIITFALFVITAISFAFDDKRGITLAMLMLSFAGMVTALLPLAFYGADGYSAVGLALCFLMFCSAALSAHRMSGTLFVNMDEEEN